MSTKANESFSAFLDGEATELDIQRMLKAMEKEPSVVSHWHDLSKVQAAIQGDPVLDQPQTLTLTPEQETASQPPRKRWRLRVFQGGIAAAVAALVMTSAGLQLQVASNDQSAVPVIAVQNQTTEQVQLLTQQQYEAQQQLEHFLREHAEQAAFTTGHVVVPAPLQWVETE
jgi:sigma-E factor negative regulatory protein RseA